MKRIGIVIGVHANDVTPEHAATIERLLADRFPGTKVAVIPWADSVAFTFDDGESNNPSPTTKEPTA